jgi:hypothetical protein
MFETVPVPSFGGGLNLTGHPAVIDPSEWTWCDGFLAKYGCAETLPTYVQVRDNAYLAGGVAHGLLQNPFRLDQAALVVAPGSPPKLFKVSETGATTEVPWDGVGASPMSGPASLCMAGFLNGFLVISAGISSTNSSLFKWNGGATFAAINPSAPVRGLFLASFGGHLVTAYTATSQAGARTVRWSDANAESVWDPAVSNSADDVLLDDVESGIVGMAPLGGDALGIFTGTAVYVLTPTGGIPSFTRQIFSLQGHTDIGVSDLGVLNPVQAQYIGVTPYGLVYCGHDDFYLVGSGGVGSRIFRYYLKRPGGTEDPPPAPFVWHRERGVLIVPKTKVVQGLDTLEFLYFDPTTHAWSRGRAVKNDGSPLWIRAHALITSRLVGNNVPNRRHWLISADISDPGAIYREDPSTAIAGAFVDTKDFAFEDPLDDDYLDRIKLDWEPLTNAATDAIEVLAYTRNDLTQIIGSPGFEQDFTSLFVSQGTLTGAQSELPLRLRGRYTRLRFKQVSGRVRIRGFSLRRERAGDRRASTPA